MGQQTHNLDFVAQKLLLLGIKLGFVNLFKRVSLFGRAVRNSKDLGKLASSQLDHVFLVIELLDVVVAAVELKALDPLINDLLVLVEEHALPEALPVMVNVEAKHGAKCDLLEVESFQKDNVYKQTKRVVNIWFGSR